MFLAPIVKEIWISILYATEPQLNTKSSCKDILYMVERVEVQLYIDGRITQIMLKIGSHWGYVVYMLQKSAITIVLIYIEPWLSNINVANGLIYLPKNIESYYE